MAGNMMSQPFIRINIDLLTGFSSTEERGRVLRPIAELRYLRRTQHNQAPHYLELSII